MKKYGNEKRSTLFALDMMKGIWYLGTLPKLNLEHKSSKSRIYLVYSRKSGTSSNYFLHLENHFYMFDYFSYLQESFVHRTAGCQVKQTIVNNKNNPSLVWEHTWEYSNKNAKTKTQNKQNTFFPPVGSPLVRPEQQCLQRQETVCKIKLKLIFDLRSIDAE